MKENESEGKRRGTIITCERRRSVGGLHGAIHLRRKKFAASEAVEVENTKSYIVGSYRHSFNITKFSSS